MAGHLDWVGAAPDRRNGRGVLRDDGPVHARHHVRNSFDSERVGGVETGVRQPRVNLPLALLFAQIYP